MSKLRVFALCPLILGRYQVELVAIRGQDWITFRARIFELQVRAPTPDY